MDKAPILKLLLIKEAEVAAISKDVALLSAEVHETEKRLATARSLFADRSKRQQALQEEIELLKSAMGPEERETSPDSTLTTTNTQRPFQVELAIPPDGMLVKVDLNDMDLSDGEPKVRQHTIEVRKRAIALIAKRGPLASAQIIDAFDADGFSVSSDKQVANLSAVLSRTSFFTSTSRRWHLDVKKLLAARDLSK